MNKLSQCGILLTGNEKYCLVNNYCDRGIKVYRENLPYDKTSPEDIERYAKNLEGKTFYEVLDENVDAYKIKEAREYFGKSRSKGGLGNLLEEHYFFYEPNSDSEADFAEAGVELKVTPYEFTKTAKMRAGERLVIGMISNHDPIERDFYKSHLLEKMQLMLLIFYLREKDKKRLDYRIDYVLLFSILSEACKEDLEIIIDDYEKIADKIISGRAHELSEGDTKYLGACTKGGTAKSSIQPQYYNPDVPAKRRAFSLKQGYMTYVLNTYVKNEVSTYDSAFTAEELKNLDFDNEIVARIDKYKGKTEDEIYQLFEIDAKVKQKNNLAVCRMVGVKTDRVAEFEKADIKIKTIRVKENGKPRESMSFPAMVIKDFVKETFENSEVYRYFSETRFLFVVFREGADGKYRLSGSKFWNMPIMQLETIGKYEWEAFKNKFISGVELTPKKQKNGIIVKNDLPGQKETKIFHLRPHAQKAAHVIDGVKYGSGSETDMDELPNGDKMTKQCFWLNNSYVADIINNI